MQVHETKLPGVLLVEPKVHTDDRGFFTELWNSPRYAAQGLPGTVLQTNLARSSRGVLRGLHHQYPCPQGKLVFVLEGEVFDVAVDIRHGSPTFGQWVGYYLSQENHRQLYVPPGFAHGYCVISATSLFAYQCTEVYHREYDASIRFNDPDINVAWPIDEPVISEKDRQAPRLRDVPSEKLPQYADYCEIPAR